MRATLMAVLEDVRGAFVEGGANVVLYPTFQQSHNLDVWDAVRFCLYVRGEQLIEQIKQRIAEDKWPWVVGRTPPAYQGQEVLCFHTDWIRDEFGICAEDATHAVYRRLQSIEEVKILSPWGQEIENPASNPIPPDVQAAVRAHGGKIRQGMAEGVKQLIDKGQFLRAFEDAQSLVPQERLEEWVLDPPRYRGPVRGQARRQKVGDIKEMLDEGQFYAALCDLYHLVAWSKLARYFRSRGY